jgi:hypothetical protein
MRHPSLSTVARASVVAGALSGVPSTAHAVATRRPLLASVRAAGTLLGRPTLPRGVVAHTTLTVAWTTLLTAALPRRRIPAAGAFVGLGIAVLDLAIAQRRFPAIAALPPMPQVLDHIAFGALVGVVLAADQRHVGDTG